MKVMARGHLTCFYIPSMVHLPERCTSCTNQFSHVQEAKRRLDVSVVFKILSFLVTLEHKLAITNSPNLSCTFSVTREEEYFVLPPQLQSPSPHLSSYPLPGSRPAFSASRAVLQVGFSLHMPYER
ncbi:unnamed protein product [Victoria cruziana]